jgi:hypothetical protein
VSTGISTVSTLSNFNSLASQFAMATPSPTNSQSYNGNGQIQKACPTMDTQWNAGTVLPPTPNNEVCACMISSLECIANSSINYSASAFATLKINAANAACGSGNGLCDATMANGTMGTYGAYSSCTSVQVLSWLYNEFYIINNRNASFCGLKGEGIVQKTFPTNSTCNDILEQAGPRGTNTITSLPAFTRVIEAANRTASSAIYQPSASSVNPSATTDSSGSSSASTKLIAITVGITIGALLPIIGATIAIWLCVRKRRLAAKEAPNQTISKEDNGANPDSPYGITIKAEMPGEDARHELASEPVKPPEMAETCIIQLPADEAIKELPSPVSLLCPLALNTLQLQPPSPLDSHFSFSSRSDCPSPLLSELPSPDFSGDSVSPPESSSQRESFSNLTP